MIRFTAPLLGAALLMPAIAVAQTTPAPAPAQPPAGQASPTASSPTTAATPPAVGTTIYDTAGGVVGTVDSVAGDVVVVSTGANKVGIPVASFGTGAKGPVVAITKAALDATAAQQRAAAADQLQAQLVAGTAVRSRNGTAAIGTIKAVDGEFVTLTTPSNGDVRLPRSGFSSGPSGVIIGMTADEFSTAISGAGGSAAPKR